MLITVVNQSDYTDAYVQEVIRAVNRQIAEDFAAYWHRTGRLRLEGPIGRRPDPKQPEELRGEAILYLWNDIDEAADALGFHQLNYRGIPYGIVFTEMAEGLGEEWTVTFSHEALELVMDPEANLLVEGPHPDDPERSVYHWYEVCDAVQTQSYEIDGVRVSNFVLPLYFTEADEEGSRNDFLGDEEQPLPSFGVASGGYIGFFDPETGQHEQAFSPEGDARARFERRGEAGYTRRVVRRRVERAPESVLRDIIGVGKAEPLPAPLFESLAVDVRGPRGADPYDVLDAAARAVLGAGWQRSWEASEPSDTSLGADKVFYDLEPKGDPPTPAEAWQAVYAFREQPGVVDAEPEFEIWQPDPEAILDLDPRRRAYALWGKAPLPGSEHPDWCIEQIRANEAWQDTRGEGVRVGHPDTGYFRHPEIWPNPLDLDHDRDFESQPEDPDAHAENENSPFNPGGPNHGTATASVIVAASGPSDPPLPPHPEENVDGPVWVSGVAPGASLIPLRVSNGVVHLSWKRLRRSIEYAMRPDVDIHILSMSLGSPWPSRRSRAVIREATRRGLVLVAAAGNSIPFRPVVWPARYPEVVACAGSNIEEKPWDGSSRGGAIDVTAPAQDVWRAFVDTSEDAEEPWLVGRSDGTSYAAAHVAGACALWMSHHGREFLVERYGERTTDAFRFALAETCAAKATLPSHEFGPGRLDARALLDWPLPTKGAVATWADGDDGLRARRAAVRRPAEASMETLRALFPGLSVAELKRGLAALLGVEPGAVQGVLRDVGDELAFHLAVEPRLRRSLMTRCREAERTRRHATYHGLCAALFDQLAGDLRARGSRRLQESLRPPRS